MINEPATMEALRRVIEGDIPVAKAKTAENGGVQSFEGRTGEVDLTESDFGKVFRVGDLWITTGGATPSARFGGTWTKLTDVFLHAADSVLYPARVYGQNTVTLTTAHIPYHEHYYTPAGEIGNGGSWWMNNFYIAAGSGKPGYGGVMAVTYGESPYAGGSSQQGYAVTGFQTSEHTHTFTGTRALTEGAGTRNPTAVSIMPRYTDVYVWRKIA